jgi:tetratricopeptide (TPR) repeat protein
MKPTFRPAQFSVVVLAALTRALPAIVILIATLFAAGTAVAGDREDAAKEFDLGQQSEKAGNFTTALDHYLKSYELIPHPATAYNIASNYEKIGKARQAAQYFNTYLEQDPQADDKDKVKKKIVDLQNLPARIVVRSSPPGAQVTIDSGPQAREPIVLSLKGGDHEVTATLQGQTQTQRINAQFGEPQEIVITFGASTAIINVWSTANNTTVSVDGAVVGTAPLAVTVSAGQHQVTASALGFVPQTKPVVVQAGRAEQLSFSLVAAGRTTSTSSGTSTAMNPSESRLKFVFGLASGGTVIEQGTGGAFTLHGGIRFGSFEAYATLGGFGQLDNVTDPLPSESELVRGGVLGGLGIRKANFAGRGLALAYSSNIFINNKAAFDARLGLFYNNLLNGSIKTDLFAEVGVGIVGRADGKVTAYVPVLFGLMFHR